MTQALRRTKVIIGRRGLLRCSALGLVLAALEILPARAAPGTASIPAGVAAAPTITSSGPVTDVKLNQSRTLIDWSSFAINPGETVNFRFNAGSDIVLNRVLGRAVVDGALNGLVGAKVGGNVWLYGAQGVVFGPNARVNVGSLLATTAPLSSVSEFLSGSNTLTFEGGAGDASVLARSGARLSSLGALALIAPSVTTEAGAQITSGGTALYGAAQNFRIHFDESAGGNLDLVDFEVPASALEDGSVSATPLAIAGDTAGNKAIFAAVSRPTVMNAVISLGGLVTARSAVQGQGGDIILSASGASASVLVGGALQADRSVALSAPGGRVEVSGPVTARDASGQGGAITLGDGATGSVAVDAGARLDVASTGAGQAGGRTVVTGTAIAVEGSIDASAPAGGGSIRIGGGFHGQDPGVSDADQVAVAPGAVLNADATAAGDGGTVVLWSQNYTAFGGLIRARGGPGGGDGGQAEVSSAQVLNYAGLADLTAPKGAMGGLLLDPSNIDIKNGSSNYNPGDTTFDASQGSTIDPTQIATQIASAALTISASGTITFSNTIQYGGTGPSAPLELDAGGGFVFKASNATPFTYGVGAGALNLTLNSFYPNPNPTAHAGFSLPSGFTLDTNGGTLAIQGDSISLAGAITSGSVNLTSTVAAGGGISGAGSITASNLTASAAGDAINLTGALAVSSSLAASSTTGDVILSSASNAISGTVASLSGATVTVDNGGALTVTGSGMNASTALNLTSTAGAVTVAGTTGLSTAGDVTLKGTGLTLDVPVTSTAGSLFLTATGGGLALNQPVQAHFGVTLNAAGDITQTAAITSAGLSATASGGHDVDLGLTSNAIITPVTLSGANVTLYDNDPLTVHALGVSGSASVSLTGTSVTVDGAVQSSGGPVSLVATNGAVTLNQPVQASTTLGLQATADISQDPSAGAITAASLSAASSGGNVTLNAGGNIIGALTNLTGGNVAFSNNESSSISAGNITIHGSGSLTLATTTGDLTVTGPLSAPGAVTLTAAGTLNAPAMSAAGDVSLTGFDLNLAGSVQSTGGGVALNNQDTVAGLTVAPSSISANSFVTLTSRGPLTVNAALTANGDITLAGSSLTLAGSLTSNNGGVSLTAGALALNQTVQAHNAVGLQATGGGITQSAPIISNGLSATATGGDVDLNSTSNAIAGTVALSGANVTLYDNDPLTVDPTGVSGSSSVSLTGTSVTLNGAVQSSSGSVLLDATSGGITQTAAITSNGLSATATGGAVTLDSASNAIGGTVSALSGSSVSFANGQGLTVQGSGVSTSGALTLSAAGALTTVGSVAAGGTVSLTGSSLSLGGTVQSTGGAVSLDATGAGLALNQPILANGGAVLQASGGITQTASITSTGLSATSAGGDVNLNSSANAISGTVTTLSGANVTLANGGPLTVAGSGMNASGALTLDSSGALTVTGATGLTTAGNISLTGASLSFAGPVQSTAGSVSLDATGGGLALNQAVLANTSVSLQAAGDITQTAAITSGDFYATTTGGVNLALTTNAITGTVQSLSGSNIALADGQAMTVKASGVSTPGNLSLTSLGALTVNGTLTAGGSVSLSGTSLNVGNVHSGGGLSETTSGALTSGGETASGDITLAGSSLTLTGPVQSTGGSVTLGAASSALTLDQTVQAATSVNLSAQGDISQTSAGAISSNGLSATSTAGNVLLTTANNAVGGAVALAGGDVSFTDIQSMTVSAVSASGALHLTSSAALSVTGALTAGGNLALTGSSLSLGGPVQSTSGGVSLDSTASALTINQRVTAGSGQTVNLVSGGPISQSAGGAITAATLTGQSVGGALLNQANAVGALGPFTNTGGGSVTFNSSQDLSLSGAVADIGGTAAITANSIALNSPVTAGSIVLQSTNGAVAGTGVLTATNGLQVQANGGQTALTGVNQVAGPITLSGAGVSFVNGQTTSIGAGGLASTGSITLTTTSGDLSVSGTLSLPDSVTLTAAGALAAPGVMTTSGGVSFAGSSVALGGDIQAPAGAVSVQSAAALDIDHNITAGGAVSLVSAAQVAEDASGSAVTAGRLDVTAAGGIVLNNANAIPIVDSLANTGGGGVSFHDTAASTALGTVSTGGGDIQVSATGDLALSAAIDAPAGLTLTSGGDLTAGQLTLGGNLSLNAGGAAAVSQIQGQSTSQLAVSGANVSVGAAAGQAPGPSQSVTGILSVTAQQDASVNLSGDVNIAQISAGHAASVSAQNGSAQVAAATLGAGGTSLSISSTGGDAILGAGAGTTPVAGNVLTAPSAAAIAINGGRDAVVNLAGPVTVSTLSAGRDGIAHATSGDLAVASAQAGRNLTVISDSGNANLKTATLTGPGALTLTAAKTATLGRLPGEAPPAQAGSLTLDPDSVTVSGASVVVDLAGDASLTSVRSVAGDAAINATGAIDLGQASSSGKLALSSGGAVTIGSASAAAAASVASGGAITTGSLTAPTLLLRGRQLTLDGPLQATQSCAPTCAASTLTIESVGGALGLGDGAGSNAGMQIGNAQFGLIQADAVTLYAGDTTNSAARGDVRIGDLTLDASKVKALTVLAGPASKVTVTGAVLPGASGGGTLVIGAANAASGWTPGDIYVTGSKGSLGRGDPNAPLAGQKPLASVTLNAVGDVLFGGDTFVSAIDGAEAAGKTSTINVDRNLPPGVAVAGVDLNREFLTADTMTVRANGVIAQENTGVTGQSNGILLTNRNGGVIFATLGRTGPPAGSGPAPQVIDLSMGYFSSAGVLINQQIAAASPGVALVDIPRSDVYRINGCTIGAAGSCTPLPNTIVDISIGKLVQDIRLIAQDPPPTYDPTITGAGNEEIWRAPGCTPAEGATCR